MRLVSERALAARDALGQAQSEAERAERGDASGGGGGRARGGGNAARRRTGGPGRARGAALRGAAGSGGPHPRKPGRRVRGSGPPLADHLPQPRRGRHGGPPARGLRRPSVLGAVSGRRKRPVRLGPPRGDGARGPVHRPDVSPRARSLAAGGRAAGSRGALRPAAGRHRPGERAGRGRATRGDRRELGGRHRWQAARRDDHQLESVGGTHLRLLGGGDRGTVDLHAGPARAPRFGARRPRSGPPRPAGRILRDRACAEGRRADHHRVERLADSEQPRERSSARRPSNAT